MKQRFARPLTLGIVFALGCWSVLVYFLNTLPLAESILQAARERSIPLTIQDASITLPGNFKLQTLGVLLSLPASLPLPLVIDSVTLAPQFSSILLFRPTVQLEGNLYGGTLRGRLESAISGSPERFALKAWNLVLDRHPLPEVFGVSGKIGFELLARLPQQPTTNFLAESSGTFVLSWRNGSYIGGDLLAGIYRVPAFENLSLNAQARLRHSRLTLNSLKLTSSLGSVRARGIVKFTQAQRIHSAQFRATIELTQAGKQAFEGLLEIAAGSPHPVDGKKWQLSYTLGIHQGTRLQVLPLN